MTEEDSFTVIVDAATGPTVSVGQKVEAGQVLGRSPDQKPVLSPVHGTVKACVFDPDDHLLHLLITK
jgi:Na+-translocating ferredoxin:NAD+ oxidoreductase RnfC subunit